jgi:hypothetical protein
MKPIILKNQKPTQEYFQRAASAVDFKPIAPTIQEHGMQILAARVARENRNESRKACFSQLRKDWEYFGRPKICGIQACLIVSDNPHCAMEIRIYTEERNLSRICHKLTG